MLQTHTKRLLIHLIIIGFSGTLVSDLIAYDLNTNPKIIWSSETGGKINRVNFDGTGYQLLIVDNNTYGVALQENGLHTGVVHELLPYDNTFKKELFIQHIMMEK